MRLRFKIIFFFSFILFSGILSAQWQATATLPKADYIYSFAQISYIQNGIEKKYQYAGTSAGVFASADYGNNWTARNSGLSDLSINTFLVRGTTIYTGNNGGLYISTNKGTTWSNISSYSSGFTMPVVYSIVIYSKYLLASTLQGVFRSTDGGENWIAANAGLIKNETIPSVKQLLLANNNGVIFAATGNGIYVTNNYGGSWSAVNTGLPAGVLVYCLAMRGTELFAGTNMGIYKSVNLGINWFKVGDGLAYTVNSFAVAGANIYAGTVLGVYLSTDGGYNWNLFNEGLTSKYVLSLSVMGTYLMAGTYQGGVWRRQLDELLVSTEDKQADLPSWFTISQNYPNPFNPSTKIRYGLAVKSKVTITIYNAIGQVVGRPVDEIKSPGYYSIDWNGKNYSSGIYLYKYEVEPVEGFTGYHAIKKMLLLK